MLEFVDAGRYLVSPPSIATDPAVMPNLEYLLCMICSDLAYETGPSYRVLEVPGFANVSALSFPGIS